jgi:hypothetical protein
LKKAEGRRNRLHPFTGPDAWFLLEDAVPIPMKKPLLICLLASLCFLPVHLRAGDPGQETDAVLNAAEGLFMAMQGKDYEKIWTLITRKSRSTIAANTCAAIKSPSSTKDSVADDFSRGGPISRAYWDAFLKNFDPAMILDQSRWEMGQVGDDRAEIVITHKKAQKAVVLYMAKEDGMWRAGLTESFWSRK